jgi:hypothetical protein
MVWCMDFRLLFVCRRDARGRSEHSCCTGRSTGHLSTLGPYCRARASKVPSREPEFASEYQTKWDSGFFLVARAIPLK